MICKCLSNLTGVKKGRWREDGILLSNLDNVYVFSYRNFHTWNETWMTRPDLLVGLDGWQVVDATPLEKNLQDRRTVVGPCPLIGIKDGNSLPYDTNFVIAEVCIL